MNDEFDLLNALNPVPEVRGNPGPVPSTDAVVAPSLDDDLVAPLRGDAVGVGPGPGGPAGSAGRAGSGGDRRFGGARARWAAGVVGIAAIAAVAVGIASTTGGGGDRVDQVVTTIEDPVVADPPTDPVVDPSDPTFAEEATGQTTPAAEESVVPTDARIPWPAPIVIDVTPETASADRVIEVPAGVVVLEIRGSGWDSGEYDMLDLCEVFGVAADDSGDVAYSITNGCTWAESRFIDEGSEFAELIVADVRSAHQLTLSSTQSGLGPIALATLDPGDGPPLPTLLDGSPADSSAFPDPRVAAVDRSSGRTQLAGAGWSASIPIAFHACFTEADNTLPIDSCSLVATIDPTATGSFESAVPIPGADSRSPGDPAASYVVATQGDRLAVVGLRHREPELVDFSSIPEIPGVVDITIRGLRSGELASIERCEGNCRSLTQVIEVVGSGSGQDIVPVSLTAETREIQLVIDGEPISFLDTPPDFAIVEAAIPVEIPDDAPQATITVEPASVPGPGTYEFVVRGDGWLAAPPVFVLPCEAGATGVSAEEIGDTCDTSALTPATPEDQSFEVTVTYDVGPDGMTIAAGDAAQSQLATAGVTVE